MPGALCSRGCRGAAEGGGARAERHGRVESGRAGRQRARVAAPCRRVPALRRAPACPHARPRQGHHHLRWAGRGWRLRSLWALRPGERPWRAEWGRAGGAARQRTPPPQHTRCPPHQAAPRLRFVTGAPPHRSCSPSARSEALDRVGLAERGLGRAEWDGVDAPGARQRRARRRAEWGVNGAGAGCTGHGLNPAIHPTLPRPPHRPSPRPHRRRPTHKRRRKWCRPPPACCWRPRRSPRWRGHPYPFLTPS